jgi:hypothetical protein
MQIPQKKGVATYYFVLVFLYPLQSLGHLVHSGAFDCETLMHYFSCSGGTVADTTKSAPGHVASNLCFCIPCDLLVTY